MKHSRSVLQNGSSPFFITLLSACLIFISACHHQPQTPAEPITMKQADSSIKKFTAAMVDNKKDPNCGMPVTAGIEDTVHYNGKVYGFCSDQCRDAFLKNPEELAKNAILK